MILQVARTELGTDQVALAPPGTAHVASAGSASASRMTWMAAGAVRDACRAALDEQKRVGGDVDVERVYRHLRTTPLDPETGQVTGDRAHVSFAVAAMRVVAEVDVDLGCRGSSGSAPRRTSARRSTRWQSRARSRGAPRRGSGSR